MKVVVYEAPRQVSVKDVPEARMERPSDVLVWITTTTICGSDLHLYEGRTDFEPGRWSGHENLGEVVEVGDGVDKVGVGDWVVLSFNITWARDISALNGVSRTGRPSLFLQLR